MTNKQIFLSTSVGGKACIALETRVEVLEWIKVEIEVDSHRLVKNKLFYLIKNL